MIGRAAYEDSWLLARLDAALGGVEVAAEADVLARYERYVARELARGTPLKQMTRHLLGMRSGRAGGRVWRRALGELGDGAHGLAALRRLVQTFALVPAFSPS